jgi:hypothetical protein
MSMPISNGSNVEVVTSVQRRRRWTLIVMLKAWITT